MNNKILIAYATTHGSTLEIAREISNTLRHDNQEVELLPARTVKSLEGYSAVILGAPLYMFKWHGDAFRFLNKNRASLEKNVPIAVFAGGPTGKGDEEEWQVVRTHFQKEMAKVPWLKPASVQLVGGKFDPSHLVFPYNLIPALKNLPAVDFRDWPAIQSWVQSLPAVFKNAAQAVK